MGRKIQRESSRFVSVSRFLELTQGSSVVHEQDLSQHVSFYFLVSVASSLCFLHSTARSLATKVD